MSLYGILGVVPEAKDIEIRRAYRKLALRSDDECCATTYRKLCDIPVLVSFLSTDSDVRIQPDSPRHCYSFQLLAPTVERITARSGEADVAGTPLTSGYSKPSVACALFQTAPR
jgi:hypothetical protein